MILLSFTNLAMTTKLMHSADISEWMEACAEKVDPNEAQHVVATPSDAVTETTAAKPATSTEQFPARSAERQLSRDLAAQSDEAERYASAA